MFKKKNKKQIVEEKVDDSLTFNADNEIIIGLKRIPDEPKRTNKRTSRKRKNKKNKKKINKGKTKRQETKKDKFAKIIAFFVMIMILVTTAIIITLYSPLFNITEIKVCDNNKISSEQIISISGIKLNQNIYQINKARVVDNIKQNSYVENAKIKRILPNIIEINIEERINTFVLQLQEGFAYINNQGYILEVSSEKSNKPVIEGFSTKQKDIIQGRRLNNSDLEKLEDVLKIVESCNNNDIGSIISSISMKEKANYKINFETEGKVAYIGDLSNLTTKILYIKSILEKEKENEGEIFVNVDLNTQNVFFRESV